jgi:hypothetical protein
MPRRSLPLKPTNGTGSDSTESKCGTLARKYARAARYPSLSAEPDPTEPSRPATVMLEPD